MKGLTMWQKTYGTPLKIPRKKFFSKISMIDLFNRTTRGQQKKEGAATGDTSRRMFLHSQIWNVLILRISVWGFSSSVVYFIITQIAHQSLISPALRKQLRLSRWSVGSEYKFRLLGTLR